MKTSEEKITDVLKLFAQSPTIKTFLVDDFFKRAKETIQLAAKDDFLPLITRDDKCVVATKFRERV